MTSASKYGAFSLYSCCSLLELNNKEKDCLLRPTTRECVHLVTRGRFRSLDKDGGHTIRSVISENPMAHANPMGLSFIEPELRAIEVLHYGKRDFRLVLLLWPWTWPDDLHIRIWPVFSGDTPDVHIWTPFVKAFESTRLTDIHTDTQTRPKTYTMPLCGWLVE